MPRYHLNLRNAHLTAPDADGLELPDLQAASLAALQGIRSLLSAEVKEMGRMDMRGEITITDDAGSPLQIIKFAEAVSILRQ